MKIKLHANIRGRACHMD